MGWLFQNDPLRHETPASYIVREFSHHNEQRRATVLATATVGNVIYAAIRNEEKTTGQTYVFAGVFLFKNTRREGVGYKDMSEGMGPHECDCPDRIMRLLSRVEDIPDPSYSTDWRARVAASKARRQQTRKTANAIAIGDVVRLCSEVTFRGGVRAEAFRMIAQRKRTPIFEPLSHPGMRCRLPMQLVANAAVERAAAATPDAAS